VPETTTALYLLKAPRRQCWTENLRPQAQIHTSRLNSARMLTSTGPTSNNFRILQILQIIFVDQKEIDTNGSCHAHSDYLAEESANSSWQFSPPQQYLLFPG
jgi:hypothetical protein